MALKNLIAGNLEFSNDEIVSFILRVTDQNFPCPTNAASILDFLSLRYLSTDFERDLNLESIAPGFRPRALLSFSDRIVAVDTNLSPNRLRFSVLHEIAHFVLPAHQHALYLCDDSGLSARTQLRFEAEANKLAADLLFKGPHFTLAANSSPPSAGLVKELATTFEASFEATARRLVEKNIEPVLLVVFEPSDNLACIDPTQQPSWSVRYCIPSPQFKNLFFSGITGPPPEEIVTALREAGRDISNSILGSIGIEGDNGAKEEFQAEWFYNQYNIFAFIRP